MAPSSTNAPNIPDSSIFEFPSPKLLKPEYPRVALSIWATALDRRSRHILAKLPVLGIDKPHIPASTLSLSDIWSALEYLEFQFPLQKPVCVSLCLCFK